MRIGMPFDIRRRCELTMAQFRADKITQDVALQEIFKLMKRRESLQVDAAEFQDYVDTIMVSGENNGKDLELEKEAFRTWKD
jgi:hypothetical protein